MSTVKLVSNQTATLLFPRFFSLSYSLNRSSTSGEILSNITPIHVSFLCRKISLFTYSGRIRSNNSLSVGSPILNTCPFQTYSLPMISTIRHLSKKPFLTKQLNPEPHFCVIPSSNKPSRYNLSHLANATEKSIF